MAFAPLLPPKVAKKKGRLGRPRGKTGKTGRIGKTGRTGKTGSAVIPVSLVCLVTLVSPVPLVALVALVTLAPLFTGIFFNTRAPRAHLKPALRIVGGKATDLAVAADESRKAVKKQRR